MTALHWLVAGLSGALFGLGLAVGGMTLPAKVIAFLDVAGNWDPSLMFVMGGAIAVYTPIYRWARRNDAPVLGGRFRFPERTSLDARLLVGAGLFGVGWGLAGYCPGPALASLSAPSKDALLFVGAMLLGMWLFKWIHLRVPREAPPLEPAPAQGVE